MKQITIFLSFISLLFASGFGENYYNLNIEQKRQVFFKKMNEMFDKSFENIEQERAFVEAFFKKEIKGGFRTSNQKDF